MKNEQLQGILQELGLSKNESSVYLSALSLGPTSILSIAKSSGIRRTTVYTVVEALKKKGLMHVQPKGLKQQYVVEHPEKLVSILESRKKRFEKHLPEFLSLYNLKGTDSTIKYYEGLESIKTIYDTVLNPMKPSDDYLVISDLKTLFDLDKKYFDAYLEKRVQSKVQARAIVTDSEQSRYLQKYGQQMNHELHVLPPGKKLFVDIMISPYQVTILNLQEPLTAIQIENPTTVIAFKEMFELMWGSLK